MSTSNVPAWHARADEHVDVRGLARAKTPWFRIRRSALFATLLCVVLIAAADVMFYRQPIGLTLGLFIALVAVAIGLRSDRFLQTWHGRLVALGLLGVCLALIEHPGPLRMTLAVAGLLSLVLINSHGWTASVPVWLARWAELIGRCAFQLPVDMFLGHRWRRKHEGSAPSWQRLAINWALPLALSSLFVIMFAAANPIISKWVGNAGQGIQRLMLNFGEYVSFGRVLLWLLVGFTTWALLRGRSRVNRFDWEGRIFAARRQDGRLPRAALIVRCLALFNVVFAVQLALDLVTVLSNGQTLPEGMTYSEYARRGAYPLVATALMAAGFVLIAFPTGQSTAALEAMRWARRLVYLWIAQNIILTLSAGWRLSMYVEAFGLTRLRVAAAIWMFLVAAGLMWIIWRIIRDRSNSWLMRVNFATLLVVLYGCCFVNFDSIIASYGLAKCKELGGPGPKIDLRYMASLGPEAIPALESISDKLRDSPAGVEAGTLAHELHEDLENDLQRWQGWTIRRARLAALGRP